MGNSFNKGVQLLESLTVIQGSEPERRKAKNSLETQYEVKFRESFKLEEWEFMFLAACQEWIDRVFDERMKKYWPSAEQLLRIVPAEERPTEPAQDNSYHPPNVIEKHLAILRRKITAAIHDPKRVFDPPLPVKVREAVDVKVNAIIQGPNGNATSTSRADKVIAAYNDYAKVYRSGGLYG